MYTIKVQAVDTYGTVGEAAYLYNVTIEDSMILSISARTTSFVQQANYTTYTNTLVKTIIPTLKSVSPEDIQSRSQTAAVVGGVAGAVVFFGFGVLIFLFVRGKIRNKSIKVNLFLSAYSTKNKFFLVNPTLLLLHGCYSNSRAGAECRARVLIPLED